MNAWKLIDLPPANPRVWTLNISKLDIFTKDRDMTLHNSLIAVRGNMYNMNLILFLTSGFPFMGSTQAFDCELFDKKQWIITIFFYHNLFLQK